MHHSIRLHYTAWMSLKSYIWGLFRAVIICTSALLISCSSGIKTQPLLVNKGILPLSINNPYHGPNLFLAQEAENSAYLFSFLRSRGGPFAIEIKESHFSSPKVVMYYPKEQEMYIGQQDTRENRSEWVINGPYSIQRLEYRNLSRMEGAFSSVPVFSIDGRDYRFGPEPTEPKVRVVVPRIPTPLPRPKKRVVRKPSVTSNVAQPNTPEIDAKKFIPLNSDQQALAIAKGFAERSATGDVIHTVRTTTETLVDIAKWYTKNSSNASKIAEANSLNPTTPLLVGQRIVVPIDLLKELKQMPTS